MKATITVRLRYTVTGSVSAAKQAINEKFNTHLPRLQEFAGPNYHAKKWSADIDPDEVSGYSNYPTFHVALFFSNNPLQYAHVSHEAKQSLRDAGEPVLHLAEWLENYVDTRWLQTDTREENSRTDSDTLAHELLSAALGQVNWMEIAEEWLTQAREEVGS